MFRLLSSGLKMFLFQVVLAVILYLLLFVSIARAEERHDCNISTYNDSSSASQVVLRSQENPEGELFSVNPLINESIRQAYYHSWVFDVYIENGVIESVIYYADKNGSVDKNIAQALSLFWGIVCGYVFFMGIGRG